MLKRAIGLVIISGLLMPAVSFPTDVFAYDPEYLLSDAEMLDMYAITRDQLQTFLEQRGTLGGFEGPDVNGHVESAADIIYDSAIAFDLNPQFLLVLLQREQSLVEDDNPSQDQFDWAMGYAICDDCDKDDPVLQKYRGFGNQVYHAAKRIRESYLTDLEQRGFTIGGIGPEILSVIDGVDVIPANFATAALYTYTPHLHGNENFVRIWNRWFVRDYPTGALLQDETTGGIWLIQYGKRRPITSRTAFLTRFNPNNVIPVKPSALDSYEIGTPISFPNYSLLRSPRGTVFLIVDDTRRGFDSQEAFRSLGFNSDEVMDVSWDDLAAYTDGAPITADSAYPQGALLQDSATGGIFYVENDTKYPIMSREILNNRFPGRASSAADATALSVYETGEPVGFQDGTLIGVVGSPDVFVVSEGLRRPIVDEEAFLGYGWRWEQITWTNERSVLLHDLGSPITLEIPESPELQATSYQLPAPNL